MIKQLYQISAAFLGISAVFYFVNIVYFAQKRIRRMRYKTAYGPSGIPVIGSACGFIGICFFPGLSVVQKVIVIACLFVLEFILVGFFWPYSLYRIAASKGTKPNK